MKLDRYKILRRADGRRHRLHHGRFATSYKALDRDAETPVVVTVIRPDALDDAGARERFLAGPRAAAALRHAGIACIHQLSADETACFYVRDFVAGESMETKIRRDGPIAPAAALHLARELAHSLAAAEESGLAIANLAPENLILGDEWSLMIADATSIPPPAYSSPEALDEQPLTARSAYYSLGTLLWFLLTGAAPFQGTTAQITIAQLQSSPPFEKLQGLPRPIVTLLARLLQKEAAWRPQGATELLAELEETLRQLDSAAVAPVDPPVLPVEPPAGKISAARVPVAQRSAHPFRAVELIAGAGVAALIYLALAQPTPQPERGAIAARADAAAREFALQPR
jgi:serine/threonine-protein kinase